MRRVLLLLIVVATACASDGAATTSTTAAGGTSSVATTSTSTTSTTLAPTTSAAATTSTPTTTSSTTTTTVPGPVELSFDTRDGVAFLEVDKDDEVVVAITSDATDEVHLHGYDIKADVSPDEAAVLTFTADTPGIFEIELEGSGRRIAQLQVNA